MPRAPFSQLLAAADLANATRVVVHHEAFDKPVCAIKVNNGNCVRYWHVLRAAYPTSGYWPLIVTYIPNGEPPPWEQLVEEETDQLFSRFFFEEEAEHRGKGCKSPEPRKIIEASRDAEVHYALEAAQLGFNIELPGDVQFRLDRLVEEYGQAPSVQDTIARVEESEATPWVAIEQAIFAWELAQGKLKKPRHPPYWYEPREPLALLLLPIADGFDALAHIHWWGSFTLGTPATMALMRSWNRDHGAELMCHYGTVLQLHVPQPLTDPLAAFNVAAAMETICMQGSASESAWEMLGAGHWHLHNRP